MFGPEKREKIRKSLGGHCAYCGAMISKKSKAKDNTDAATVDHVVPRAAGGSNCDSNLLPACAICNLEKGEKTLEEYRIIKWKKINGFLKRMGDAEVSLESIRFFFEGIGEENRVVKKQNFSRRPKSNVKCIKFAEIKDVQEAAFLKEFKKGVVNDVNAQIGELKKSIEGLKSKVTTCLTQVNANNRKTKALINDIANFKKKEDGNV